MNQSQTSSQTSRAAATLGSSSGSIPPPGTIHLSGCLLLLTNNTCVDTRYNTSVYQTGWKSVTEQLIT